MPKATSSEIRKTAMAAPPPTAAPTKIAAATPAAIVAPRISAQLSFLLSSCLK